MGRQRQSATSQENTVLASYVNEPLRHCILKDSPESNPAEEIRLSKSVGPVLHCSKLQRNMLTEQLKDYSTLEKPMSPREKDGEA